MSNYYASEYTLQEVDSHIVDLTNNLSSYQQQQYLLLFVIALILCFMMVDKFVDKCLNSRG